MALSCWLVWLARDVDHVVGPVSGFPRRVVELAVDLAVDLVWRVMSAGGWFAASPAGNGELQLDADGSPVNAQAFGTTALAETAHANWQRGADSTFPAGPALRALAHRELRAATARLAPRWRPRTASTITGRRGPPSPAKKQQAKNPPQPPSQGCPPPSSISAPSRCCGLALQRAAAAAGPGPEAVDGRLVLVGRPALGPAVRAERHAAVRRAQQQSN